MGGILNLIFSKKIETYMPFYFLGVSFNKCKEVTGKLISVRLMGEKTPCRDVRQNGADIDKNQGPI